MFFAVGGCLLIIAAAFIAGHASAFRDMRAMLPTAARIPGLEARLTRIKDQLELAELHASLRNASAEERVHVFVLPKEQELDRTLGYFDVIEDALRSSRMLRSITPIDVGASVTRTLSNAVTLRARPLHMTLTVSEGGLRSFLTFIDLAGTLTVGDALSPTEQAELFRQTEAETPTAIVPLEQFLSTDLLAYAKDTKPHVERLQRAFSSESFERTFLSLERSSLLGKAVEHLRGPIGTALEAHDLWPVQFLTAEKTSLRELPDGFWEINVEVLAWSR